MSFDISNLELTNEPVDVSPDEYVAPSSGSFEAIPAGTYSTIAIPGKFKDRDSGKSGPVRFSTVKSKKDGQTYLQAEIAVKVEDESSKYNGRLLFGRVSTMPYKLIFNEVEKGRENASLFMDFLRASGYDGPLGSNQDYQDAVLLVVGEERAQRTNTDWSWYCNPNSTEYRGDGKTIRGMKKNASQNPDGSYNPRLTYRTEFGDDVVLLAKNDLKAFYKAKA